MTLEELADNTADKLAALTTEQLHDILRPYFPITRPEMVTKPKTHEQQMAPMNLSPQKLKALELLADSGVDISFMKRKRK